MQARLFPSNTPSLPRNTSEYVSANIDLGKLTITSQSYRNISLTFTADLIGELYLPQQEKANPHCERVQAQLLEWMDKMSLISSSSEDRKSYAVYQKFTAFKIAWLFSTPLRDHTSDKLLTSGKAMAFLFIVDDLWDKKDKSKSEDGLIKEIEAITNCFYAILSGEYNSEDSFPEFNFPTNEYFRAICKSLLDLRLDFEKEKAVNERPQLLAYHEYFQSILKEIKDRFIPLGSKSEQEIEEEYLKGRIHTGGVIATLEVIARLCGIEVKDFIREDPLFKEFVQESSLVLGILNDIVSSIKEASEANVNLITVKYNLYVKKLIDELLELNSFRETFLTDIEKHENEVINISSDALADFFRKENISLSIEMTNPLQKAIEDTFKIHNDKMLNVFNLCEKLCEKYQSAPEVSRYSKVAYDCLFDNCNWSIFISSRYNLNRTLDFKCNYQVCDAPKQEEKSMLRKS